MSMIIDLDDREGLEAAEAAAAPSVGTLDPGPDAITADEWKAGHIAALLITFTPPEGGAPKCRPARSYAEYVRARVVLREKGYTIISEQPKTAAELLPGLLTLDSALNIFQTADQTFYEFPAFPLFSKLAKIRTHSFITLAADTGAGKSSLAINLLDNINERLPVLYINLEMDRLQIIQRLVSIHGGLELSRVEGYQRDQNTAETVNAVLGALTARKPLQIREDLYTIEDIERKAIKPATEGRKEPTLVIIDHGLLLQTNDKGLKGEYERYTYIAKELRRISKQYNIILLCLVQMNRESKKDATIKPNLWSLKSTGEWENSSTHVLFLWYDPDQRKKLLIIAKNRGGQLGEVALDYTGSKQIYTEAATQPAGLDLHNLTLPDTTKGRKARKQSPREKRRQQYQEAYEAAILATKHFPVMVHEVAEAGGVSTKTVESWAKEFGGDIGGKHYDPAGIDTPIDANSFIRLTASAADELENAMRPVGKTL